MRMTVSLRQSCMSYNAAQAHLCYSHRVLKLWVAEKFRKLLRKIQETAVLRNRFATEPADWQTLRMMMSTLPSLLSQWSQGALQFSLAEMAIRFTSVTLTLALCYMSIVCFDLLLHSKTCLVAILRLKHNLTDFYRYSLRGQSEGQRSYTLWAEDWATLMHQMRACWLGWPALLALMSRRLHIGSQHQGQIT